MKRFLHFIAIAAIVLSLPGISLAKTRIATQDLAQSKILTPGNRQWKSTPSFVKPAHRSITPHGLTIGPTSGYSFLSGPDGSQWYATQSYTIENSYYTATEITFYNSKGEEQGKLSVTIPETGSCNQILVGEAVSSLLFDRDRNTYEVPVIMHFILSPGVTAFTTQIYDLASGELKHTYNGFMSIVQYSTGYNNEWVGVLSYSTTEEETAVTKYDIYTKPTIGKDTAIMKKSFSIPTKLAEYQVGGVFNVFEFDNSLYYVVSQYEKEYLDPASYQEPWDMIPTENNNFIATIYNKNFAEAGKVTIPVASTSQYLVQYGVGLYGYDDLSKNYWDESGNLQLVVATAGFEVSTENETIAFDVYDTNGNKVKNIVSNVSDWMKMYDIAGQSDQMAFLATDGYSLAMVDVPACDTVVVFGSTVDNEAISTNIDRYYANDSYQYVIGLAAPETADNGDILQRFAWVTKEAKIDHYAKFNVGSNNASWTPLVMGEALNPYLFDTDSQREYVFIANQYAEGATSGAITDEVRIVKEDGTIVRRYIEDATAKGDLGSCLLLGVNSDIPTMVIPFYNSTDDSYTIDLEYLPLEMFANGGDGTKQNPYLIASAGDMSMIARNPEAHYKVISDFSANDFGLWSAIPSFTGSLDGGNYTISGLTLNGNNSSAAIFASAEGAKISNLILDAPQVEIGQAGSVGFIVAEALTDTLQNIHINNAVITGSNDAYATIGAITGNAMLNTVISECLVNNLTIEAPTCNNVGGIIGEARTGSSINACAVLGNINAGTGVGGIIGVDGTDCVITNCHVDVDINGLNTIGGIAGSADRGGIHNCYVEGSLTATEANYSGYYSIGGIAGSLAPDWSTPADNVVYNNVVALSALNSPANGAHRIIGYSRLEDDQEAAKWDSSIKPTAEGEIAGNYAIEALERIDKTIEANDTTTEGANIAAADLNKDFFAGLGFKFGTDAENPWKDLTGNDPALYFEPVTTDGIESVNSDKNVAIRYNGNTIIAPGAVIIDAYNINGIKVASAVESIDTANLIPGIYVIVAFDSEGHKTIAKIAVK